MSDYCRVYWGSHGCDKKPGHRGAHACRSCTPWWVLLVPRPLRIHWGGYVGRPPYYGRATRFYGEDAQGPA